MATAQRHPLEHLIGIMQMIQWMERWHKVKGSIEFHKDTFVLSQIISARFALGVSKHPRDGAFPFLAAQRPEAVWLRDIQWDRISIKPKEEKLALISKRVPENQWIRMDIPAFAVIIQFDDENKLSGFEGIRRMEGRSMWHEEDVGWTVSRTSPLFSVPIRMLDPDQPWMTAQETERPSILGIYSEPVLHTHLPKINNPNVVPVSIMETLSNPEMSAVLKSLTDIPELMKALQKLGKNVLSQGSGKS